MFLEDPRFPSSLSYGSSGYTQTSNWSETITQTTGGVEDRNRNWQRSLKVFNCQMGPNAQDLIAQAYEFWEALAGPDVGFRFKDWVDYKSCRATLKPAASDQLLTFIPGSPGGGWQLTKAYTKGAVGTLRYILKPVQGTIQIADLISGVPHLKTEGTDYAIDYTTGLVQIFFTPTGQLTWGGEFDVPVRFDSTFPVEVSNFQIAAVTFQLTELRNPSSDDA